MKKNDKTKKANKVKTTQIRSLADLVRENITALEGVIDGRMDNRKAAVIFTGSRTITGALKLGLEAAKLGLPQIGGVLIDENIKLITGTDPDAAA